MFVGNLTFFFKFFTCAELMGSPFIDWAVLDVVQTSGGVLLIWDKWVAEKIDVSVG